MSTKKTYGSIQELELMLTLYPNQRKDIIEEAGMKFKLDGEDAFFVVAEDGNCALFNKDCKIDDLSKIKEINHKMIADNIKRINIPDSVESIEEYAFSDCKSLTSVIIPDSVESIKRNSFNNCISLKNIIIPDSVESIGYSAFFRCESLKSINIPDSVKSIRDHAFFGCEYLESINIPDSMTNIGYGAFAHCTSLTSINIPDSVKFIGNLAFYNCTSLKEVVFKGKTLDEVKSMYYYPWGIGDESIIRCEA